MSEKQYNVVNGTSYDNRTPMEIILILENARKTRTRLLFDWGDQNSGKSWGEVNDLRGYIGRSTGPVKIPLLIKTSRSLGGGAILDHCIVKISESKGGRVLWKHKNYQPWNTVQN